MGDIVEFSQRRQTGPRTERGKRRSSMNALRHGAHSKATIIAGVEDPAEFEALFRDIVAFHAIEDPVTLLAVERLVSIAWRLRRVRRIEAEKLGIEAVDYTRACAKLASLRAELASIVQWRSDVATIMCGAKIVEFELLERIEEGIQWTLDTADLTGKAINVRPVFESEQLDRIHDRGRPVRMRTARTALDAARCDLSEFIAGDSLHEFLAAIYRALEQREKDWRENVESVERGVLHAFVGSMKLDSYDERSLSDAERRLDSQFTRALHDFHAARSAAEQTFSTAGKRQVAASGSGPALPGRSSS
jgi:hypothetical protein